MKPFFWRLAFFLVPLALAGCNNDNRTLFTEPAVATATVSGPITAGSRGFPATLAVADLDAAGYVEEEFFVEGSASAFTQKGDWSIDGIWPISKSSTAEYKTRILVRRPADKSNFSGVVIVEWFNVSSNIDIDPDFGFLSEEILREGHAWVGVTAQAAPIYSTGDGPFGPDAVGLMSWDSARYQSLTHPGDEYSYDIFSQVGATLRGKPGIDPLGGLEPQILLADGESQSAFRLLTYVNAVHLEAQVFDGFLIHSRNGSGAPLGGAVPAPARVRADINNPVFQFVTETDLFGLGGGAAAFPGARQPDSENIHTWEVTGTAHADANYLEVLMRQGNLQFDNFLDLSGLLTIVNTAPQNLAMHAALHNLVAWVGNGTLPPGAPPIETSADSILRDPNGNALGGLRLPHIEVPVAVLSGEGPIQLSGKTEPFDAVTLNALYPSATAYIDAVSSAAQADVDAGYLLPVDAATIIAEAEANPPVE